MNVNVQLTGWLTQVAEVEFNHNSQTVRKINLTSLLCHVMRKRSVERRQKDFSSCNNTSIFTNILTL